MGTAKWQIMSEVVIVICLKMHTPGGPAQNSKPIIDGKRVTVAEKLLYPMVLFCF